jgi:DNA-directed RNA polymerase specialized sigma24 family protein
MELHQIGGGRRDGDDHDHDDADDDDAPMLEELRHAAQRRLRELQPALEEAERLRAVLDAIAGRPVANAPRTVELDGRLIALGPAARPLASSPKRAILELVDEFPGITASEISKLTGVKRTVVSSTVSRLKRRGRARRARARRPVRRQAERALSDRGPLPRPRFTGHSG